MRPAILFPLFADIRTLAGVGPKLEKLIAKVAGPKLVDLVFDLPVGVVDRSYRPKLAAAEAGRIATVDVTVLEHRPNRVKAQPYKVMVSDETSLMELAGLDTDDDRPKRRRPERAPEVIERLSADEAEFDDALPEHVKAAPRPAVETTDDDFLKFIEDDVKKVDPK